MKTKKFLSTLVVLTIIVSMFSGFAFAADNDPNMTAYNEQFTYTVDVDDIGTGTAIDIYAVPAASDYTPSYFDTATAAATVDWELTDGSTEGISEGTITAYALSTGYASCLTVNVAEDAEEGPASFRATNSLTDAYVDITVVINDSGNNDLPSTKIPAVIYQVIEPDAGETIHYGLGVNVAASLHTDSKSYVTIFDGVQNMVGVTLIDSYVESEYGYVSSMTIDGTPYEEDLSTYEGWQYRAYQLNGQTQEYEMIGISELLGASDMDMDTIDLISWRYGSYSDTSLFPEAFTF